MYMQCKCVSEIIHVIIFRFTQCMQSINTNVYSKLGASLGTHEFDNTALFKSNQIKSFSAQGSSQSVFPNLLEFGKDLLIKLNKSGGC